jgi:hypothetical protein
MACENSQWARVNWEHEGTSDSFFSQYPPVSYACEGQNYPKCGKYKFRWRWRFAYANGPPSDTWNEVILSVLDYWIVPGGSPNENYIGWYDCAGNGNTIGDCGGFTYEPGTLICTPPPFRQGFNSDYSFDKIADCSCGIPKVLKIFDNRGLVFTSQFNSCPDVIIECSETECPPNTCKVDCGNHICCYDKNGYPVKTIQK